MDTSKNLNSKPKDGRRSFIRKMGVAITTGVLASSVPAAARSGEENDLSLDKSDGDLFERLAILEAEKSIISLYHTYESLLNDGIYDKIPKLFALDGEAVYNGGVFKGRDMGIIRLYNNRFRSGLTGKKLDASPNIKEGHFIELTKDHLSAKAGFPFSIQAGIPINSNSTLVHMARLHGGGINKWQEKGICDLSLIRKSKEDKWIIKRLEYHTESKSVSVPDFTKIFPADPAGPDELI